MDIGELASIARDGVAAAAQERRSGTEKARAARSAQLGAQGEGRLCVTQDQIDTMCFMHPSASKNWESVGPL